MSTRFHVVKIRDKYRLIDRKTDDPAVNSKTGALIDGGGHENNAAADRQAIYMNRWDDAQQAAKDKK